LNKRTIFLLGLITLIIFPIPTFYFLTRWEDFTLLEILEPDMFRWSNISLGLSFGITFAFLAIQIMKAPIFERIPLKVENLIRDMKLTVPEAIFLSLCAGIGEELLFRSGIQYYLGIWPTSIIFVAIHGYFSFKKPLISLYGLIVLPFIVVIAYGFEHFGLWFAVSAHFAYDLVLFLNILIDKDEVNVE
jgi:uncharacterized protein